ncbi:MAG: MBL fold metallo-hydrolase [Deltaproteobacteria bacterium]|nr:MBL fold metallo-hydrolase [Deltaproteobacteria bacterium]
MREDEEKKVEGLTRRQALKASGLALGGLAVGGALIGTATAKGDGNACSDESCQDSCPPGPACYWKSPGRAQRYSYFNRLPKFQPFDFSNPTTIARLCPDEMRITFMGSCIPPVRKAQQMMSVFVEVGWDGSKPLDQFVFDAGTGVVANYGAMNVGFGRMDKIFITHLHGDHMGDVTHIYDFGPSADRQSPLYVWGPGRSDFQWTDPISGNPLPKYKDGTADYCLALRQANRWHTESFSFQNTSYPAYKDPIQNGIWIVPDYPSTSPMHGQPSAVKDTDVDGNTISDPSNDGYAIVPIELDWTKRGDTPGDNLAYKNTTTGVIITHFPVIHTRRGSIGYKLEWWPSPSDTGNQTKNHLTMIYTGDTKVESNCVNAAINGGRGIDVLIHEMVVPAQVWTMKNAYSDEIQNFPVDSTIVQGLADVEASSHSPQGPFGYLLSQISPRPRLTVATHFPVADDTVSCAMKSVQEHFPKEVVYQGNHPPRFAKNPVRITWSFDLMVINVSKHKIVEQQGNVSDFGFSPWVNYAVPQKDMNIPKYHDKSGDSDPYAQIDTTTQLPDCTGGTCNYRDDGY